MANETQSNSDGGGIDNQNSFAVIVVLPLLFALALIILLTIACLLPKRNGETDESKEKRRQTRLEKLNTTIKAEHFIDWANKERKLRPDAPFANLLCVICLEEFDDASQIRGLGCHHVFHRRCLDDWFGRWNEYCPLCHRRIMPGEKELRKTERAVGLPPPVAFMV